jgi:hypothetical protein
MNFQHFAIRKSLVTCFLASGLGIATMAFAIGFASARSAIAQTTIEDNIAQTQPTGISLAEGKATAISFENGEVITFVLLSDQSKNVYTLNAPIETGQAKSIFLRQIKTLEIPGTTTTTNPNLFVVTTNAEGNQKEYQFTINNNSEYVDSYQVAIKPTQEKPKPQIIPEIKNNIESSLGEITPEDIDLGLNTNLRKGLLNQNDPLVFAVKEYVALTMNGSSVKNAMEKVEVPLSLLQKLGTIGLQEDARRRLLPLASSFEQVYKTYNGKK